MDASCNYRESKSVQNRGDSMTTSGSKTNRSIGIGRCRVLASMAMLLGAIFTILLLPAYGQQEVDPTWYDPWAAPNTAVVPPSQPPAAVHSSQPPAATHRYHPSVRSVSPAPDAGKFRAQDKQLDQNRHNAARKNAGTPSAGSRLPGAAWLAGFETWDAASVPHGVASRSA